MALERRGIIQTKIQVTDADRANANFRKVERSLESLGRGARGATDMLRTMGPGIGIATVGVGLLVSAASRAVSQLSELGSELGAVVAAGARLSSVENGFRAAGGTPETLANLRHSTGYMRQNVDLMRQFTQVAEAGILPIEQIPDLFGMISIAADRTGESADELFRALTAAASGGGVEAFQRLGVNILGVRDSLLRMGISSESVRGRTILLQEAMRQLEENGGGAVRQTGNLVEEYERARVEITDYAHAVGQAIAEDETLQTGMSRFREMLVSSLPPVDQMAAKIIDLGLAFSETAVGIAEITQGAVVWLMRFGQMLEWIQGIFQPHQWLEADRRWQWWNDQIASIERVGSSVHEVRAAFRDMQESRNSIDTVTAAVDELGQSLSAVDRAARDAARELDSVLTSEDLDRFLFGENGTTELNTAVADRNTERTRSRSTRRGGGGQDRARAAMAGQEGLATFYQAQKQFELDQQQLERDSADRRREYHEQALEQLRQENDARRAAQETLAGFYQEQKAFEEQQFDERMRRIDAERERYRQYSEAQREAAAELKKQQWDIVNAMGSALGTVGQIFDQMTQSYEAQGKSTKALAKIQGVFWVAYNGVMAATQAAEAVADFAKGLPGVAEGIAHLAAMAAFISAAAVAGSKLGGGGSVARPAVTRSVPRNTEATGNAETQQRSYVINNRYMSIGGRRSEAALARAVNRSDAARERAGISDLRNSRIAWGA